MKEKNPSKDRDFLLIIIPSGNSMQSKSEMMEINILFQRK